MDNDKYKVIEVEGRRFQISKYSAKTGLKVAKMITSKLLPIAEPLIPILAGNSFFNAGDERAIESWSGLLSNLSLEKVSRALDLIDDDQLDKLIDWSLAQCLEVLPAGIVPIVNKNGTYGVAGIENDMLMTIRLTAEVIMFSVRGFFGENRLTGVLSPLAASLKSVALT